MPTKYTAPLYEGQKISFEEFIWRCARETAAFEFMEGEPLDAPIPTHVEVDTSPLEQAKEALAELERLQGLKGKEILALAEERHKEALKAYRERAEKLRKARKAYESFLELAQAWVPPPGSYHGLKDFMISELESALDNDFEDEEEAPPTPITDLDAFHNRLVLDQTQVLLRLVRLYHENVFKAFGQEEWIKGLRNAVPIKEK